MIQSLPRIMHKYSPMMSIGLDSRLNHPECLNMSQLPEAAATSSLMSACRAGDNLRDQLGTGFERRTTDQRCLVDLHITKRLVK